MEMWRCGDVEVWRCGGVKVWKYGDVKMWRCGDAEMRKCRAVAHMWNIKNIDKMRITANMKNM